MNAGPKFLLKRQNGFSLVQIMVLAGMLGVVSMVVVSINQSLAKRSRYQNLGNAASKIRAQLLNNLQDPEAWKQTYLSGPNADVNSCFHAQPTDPSKCPLDSDLSQGGQSCINDAKNCPLDTSAAGKKSKSLTVLASSDKQILYSSIQASSGFTASGDPCNTFSNNGNDLCPMRFELYWGKNIAPYNTEPVIRGELKYRPVHMDVSFNTANYNFQYMISADTDSVRSFCSQMQGNYDASHSPPCYCLNDGEILALGCKTPAQFCGVGKTIGVDSSGNFTCSY